jgi:hypothetical protein
MLDHSYFDFFPRHSQLAFQLRDLLPRSPYERSQLSFSSILSWLWGFGIQSLISRRTFSDPLPVPTKRKANVFEIYDGYFQREELFKDCRKEILDYFDFSMSMKAPELLELSQQIQATESVGLHIPSADWTLHFPTKGETSWNALISREYLQKALSLIKAERGDCNFYVFTDEENGCASWFPEIKGMTTVPGYSESSLAHLMLLSQCKHQILSPTTLGWWAAWLNKNDEKKVVYAKDTRPLGKVGPALNWPNTWTLVNE